MRVSLDEYLMGIASAVKARSDWPGTKVGCVAAVKGMVRSTGYNGTPKGWIPNMEEVIDPRVVKPLYCHAEENAIVQAARAGIALEGATFYSTLSCCVQCARMIINVGAARLVYLTNWDGATAGQALELLRSSHIEVLHLIKY